MRQKSGTRESSSERLVKNIRRVTRKQYSSEEKIRIVLDGLRGECSIAELCRREGIAESLYYSWSKEFLEAGKRRLAGDTARAATSSEVTDLRRDDLPTRTGTPFTPTLSPTPARPGLARPRVVCFRIDPRIGPLVLNPGGRADLILETHFPGTVCER